jgi:carbamoyltransferase
MPSDTSIYYLAIHIGHCASCAIMADGEIVYVGLEERFTRRKNTMGFPGRAIDYGLAKLGLTGKDFAKVAYTTTVFEPVFLRTNMISAFTIDDFFDYYGDRFWRRQMAGESITDYRRWILETERLWPEDFYFDYSFITEENLDDTEWLTERFRQAQVDLLVERYGISRERILFTDHHTNHAYYGYFGSPVRDRDAAVVVLDAWGDGRNYSVWRAQNDQLSLLSESTENDIGHVYKMTTLLLGMRPHEHEYKVMGLAPYARERYVEDLYEKIKDVNHVEGMRIVHGTRPDDLFAFLENAWKRERFDNVAGAVQLMSENLARKLIENIHDETGLRNFLISGGVAMNIKMNMHIAEADCVDDLFVCGSGADESLPIGCCYYLNAEAGNNQSLSHLYLGYDADDDLGTDDWRNDAADFEISENVNFDQVAQLLADGAIVARINGKAEFGARALGNRSILADPSKTDSVYRINEAIKMRDFWMPFALSMLAEQADDYIVNPKGLKAPFMSVGFDTRPENYESIRAGTHPYDRTVRPQLVEQEDCPSYHQLISAFFRRTGIPAVLNTSFNLHGEPIVNDIHDAIRTFRLSGLDHLLVGNTLISKQPVSFAETSAA